MLDGGILRDQTVQSTHIAVFNNIGDVCMKNSILRKHKYHQSVEKRALLSGKRLCGRCFTSTFSDLFKLYLKMMQRRI